MFGFGFGEMVILGVVLLVVVGPRELPKLLRSFGKGLSKLRRMSADLREQSGIDDIIQEEGLRQDLDTLRTLSRGRAGLVDSLVNSTTKPAKRRRPPTRALAPALAELTMPEGEPPDPTVEYPLVGPDSYGALADDAPDPPEATDQDSGDPTEPDVTAVDMPAENST